MNYLQVYFFTKNPDQRELLIALLGNLSFEGFEEGEDALIGCIPEDLYERDTVLALATAQSVVIKEETILPQNWNALWEQGFEPVIVPGFCTIRAGFHELEVNTPYDLVITPKMSFGTGHHATTQLMLETMEQMDFKEKKVLDFGTGTGILAILSAKLGAAKVVAIDNDEWSIENAAENAIRNKVEIQLVKATLDDFIPSVYEIILANINRNILLQYMTVMYAQLASGGQLLLSGVLYEDETALIQSSIAAGFTKPLIYSKNGWLAMNFTK